MSLSCAGLDCINCSDLLYFTIAKHVCAYVLGCWPTHVFTTISNSTSLTKVSHTKNELKYCNLHVPALFNPQHEEDQMGDKAPHLIHHNRLPCCTIGRIMN